MKALRLKRTDRLKCAFYIFVLFEVVVATVGVWKEFKRGDNSYFNRHVMNDDVIKLYGGSIQPSREKQMLLDRIESWMDKEEAPTESYEENIP